MTFDKDHLPEDNSLCVRDLQLFMKRLRKHRGKGIKFFACGEYGETFGRPHYHLILFGVDFPDKQFYSRSKNGDALYVSEEVKRYWRFGSNRIGSVTFDSCAYVARYITKKVNGDRAEAHYEFISPDGVVGTLLPEFTTQSNGIGRKFLRSIMRRFTSMIVLFCGGRSVGLRVFMIICLS